MVDGVSVFQVHHGLPQDLGKNEVIKLLASKTLPGGGKLFDIEAASNKIVLPNDSALSAAAGVPRHASSHGPLRGALSNDMVRRVAA